MNFLFVHQNFPGQFKHLAPALAARGHKVVALTMSKNLSEEWQGVRVLRYGASRGSTPNIHPWVIDIESKVIRGEACFRAALKLRDEQGFTPDAIIAHPGWGESLFLKEVWPEARLGIYCEFHYQTRGADVNFDPEFSNHEPTEPCRLAVKNINNQVHFDLADAAISPTEWQASTFPQPFRDRITVVHDGIDTSRLCPFPGARLELQTATGIKHTLTPADEVITFVNRNLEPYRGYHVFMRALPELLRARPNARVLIVGGNDVSYGARPPKGQTWKDIFIAEVRPQIPDEDWARVHFLGNIPYAAFIAMLQVSSVHVYLTYPFVLSWSLLEAMSAGCAIVASDTEPLREAIRPGVTGHLVPFFDREALVARVCALLDDPAERSRLGQQARDFAVRHYDLERICLPRQLDWVDALLKR